MKANSVFTEDELAYLSMVAVHGREGALKRLRRMKIDGVSEEMKMLHGSVIGKMEHLSDEDFDNVDIIGFLERCMEANKVKEI